MEDIASVVHFRLETIDLIIEDVATYSFSLSYFWPSDSFAAQPNWNEFHAIVQPNKIRKPQWELTNNEAAVVWKNCPKIVPRPLPT